MCMHTYHTYTPSFVRAAIPTLVGARTCACPHVCAHASAHQQRRCAQRPAPHRRPAERVPPAVARRPGRKGGAYIVQRGYRRRVPRADVRVKRRRQAERLRAEPPAVNRRREGARMCRRGCVRARSHTRTRARTDTARGRVIVAGWHRQSVRRCS